MTAAHVPAFPVHLGRPFSPTLGAWLTLFLSGYKTTRITEYGCGLGWYLRMLSDDGFTNLVGLDNTGAVPGKEFESPKEIGLASPTLLRERAFTGKIIPRHLGYPIAAACRGHALSFDANQLLGPEHDAAFLGNLRDGVALGGALVVSWADRYGRDVRTLFRDAGFDLLEDATRSARDVITEADCPWMRTTLHVFRKVR